MTHSLSNPYQIVDIYSSNVYLASFVASPPNPAQITRLGYSPIYSTLISFSNQTINTTHFNFSSDTYFTRTGKASFVNTTLLAVSSFPADPPDVSEALASSSADTVITESGTYSFIIPFSSGTQTLIPSLNCSCANGFTLLDYSLQDLSSFVSLLSDDSTYLQTLQVNHALVSFPPLSNQLMFSSSIRVSFNSSNHDRLFSVLVYRCPDPNCDECITYNASQLRGECTSCLPNYGIQDGVNCFLSLCQNGVIDGTEECDDGNSLSNDGCDSGCFIEPGYTCDGGNPTLCWKCGDHKRNGPEICDDGN